MNRSIITKARCVPSRCIAMTRAWINGRTRKKSLVPGFPPSRPPSPIRAPFSRTRRIFRSRAAKARRQSGDGKLDSRESRRRAFAIAGMGALRDSGSNFRGDRSRTCCVSVDRQPRSRISLAVARHSPDGDEVTGCSASMSRTCCMNAFAAGDNVPPFLQMKP
mgnify:CR=1 FL=1